MQVQRLKKRMTQKEVGQMLGISQNYFSMIETYAVTPPEHILYKLTKIYGCEMKDLFIHSE